MNNPVQHKRQNQHHLGELSGSFHLFVTKATHLIMKDGKKLKASGIIHNVLSIVHKKIKREAENKNTGGAISSPNQTLLGVLSQALQNVTPSLEVRKVRVSGSTYLVPAVLSKKKQETRALKWLIEAAQKKQGNAGLSFAACLADEILDASRKVGAARQKREDLHRLAQQNRAYVRYRWW